MTLTKAQEELIAIGASIGAGCHPCLEYHLSEASKAELTQSDLLQALADAECVKRSAYDELAVRGRELLAVAAELSPSCCDETSAMKEYVSVGSAVGANSLIQLQKHIDQARGVGIDDSQLRKVVAIARNVQSHAVDVTAREADRLTVAHSSAQPAPVAAAAEQCGSECACNSEATTSKSSEPCCAVGTEQPVAQNTSAGKCC